MSALALRVVALTLTASLSLPNHAPTPQEQLTNYLDRINHPAFDPDQFLALPLAVKEYEALKPLIRRLFCRSATSAPVERVFSTSRLIMRPHPAHMSSSLLETLMFLKCNADL